MQKNLMESLAKFIIKYIWLFYLVLTVLECVSTLFHASVLMKRSSDGVMQAVCGEVSNRVGSILNLMTGLAETDFVSDHTKSAFDRAVLTYPLQKSHNLFMIGVTDQAGNVHSADETDPSGEEYNLMYRDYMQRLYSTGEVQITDPIVAGSDGKTVNYTIAVPILENGKVMGSIFGSIYFDEIQEILNRSAAHESNLVYLFGNEQTIIAQSKDREIGDSFDDLSRHSIYLGTEAEMVSQDIRNKVDDSCWVFDQGRIYYVLYRHIAPADWTLLYCTDFFSMVQPLLPIMLFKIAAYFALCLVVSMVWRKLLTRKLSSVNHLLNKMSGMQMELFQNDSADYTSLLDISQSGLVDQLTGLSTRTLFYSKLEHWKFDEGHQGAVMFIDLDNLKTLNDTYGHEAGDEAILHFARILKKFEDEYHAVSTRYGGDEFILVVEGDAGDEMNEIGTWLCAQMSSELVIRETERVPINASIGIALYPEDGDQITDLICKADLALYSSKHRGKNCCAFYSSLGIT